MNINKSVDSASDKEFEALDNDPQGAEPAATPQHSVSSEELG